MGANKTGARGLVASLWAFAFLSYLLRTNISVAQQYMARDLHWSDTQVGRLFSAFLIGYTIFQVPAGWLGDRFGPRVVLAASGVSWAATTLLTGIVPGLLVSGAAAALVAVLAVRFLHGIEEAATYPVAMTAVADWFHPAEHAWITALIFTGSTLGAAFAPPLVAYVMTGLGWRATFYIAAIFPLLLAGIWWRQTRNRVHRPTAAHRPLQTGAWLRVLLRRNVTMLCLSYFLYCYAISIFVYWLFKYMVDVRHLSIVNGGWATSLPWIAASGAVPVFGYLSRRLASLGTGRLQARRLVAASCLVVAAGLLFAGARAVHIGSALTAISVCVSLLFSTESSYWSTAIDAAPDDAGAASGLMNLAGNLGGVASTVLVPMLVERLGWFQALLSGSLFALAAAACWFLLKAEGAATESLPYTKNLPRGLA